MKILWVYTNTVFVGSTKLISTPERAKLALNSLYRSALVFTRGRERTTEEVLYLNLLFHYITRFPTVAIIFKNFFCVFQRLKLSYRDRVFTVYFKRTTEKKTNENNNNKIK